MKHLIAKISKTCLVKASIFAVVCAYVSNMAFNIVGEMIAPENVVNTANNTIDVAQLALYVVARLYRSKSLSRFDVPFIIAGVVAIFS